VARASSIPRGEPANPGLNYEGLRAAGQVLLQQLTGKIWTDYNEHDPGVTILEQLCYALTELSYRAEFPVEDLLAGAGGAIELARHALFAPGDVLPSHPITQNDYRRLIADRVPSIGNLWFSPRLAGVRGLYDVTLYVPEVDPCTCPHQELRDEVRRQAVSAYEEHRNLCEDLRSVRVLVPTAATVSARVSIDEACVPEVLLARLLFNVGQFLAPELRREPLGVRLARGLAPSQIFAGPLLRDGFIDDEQLSERPLQIRVPEVARVLAQTPGVLGARGVSIRVGTMGEWSGQETIPVPRSGILTLETGLAHGGQLSIQLMRRGSACRVDAERVRRELGRLWADQRRRYPLDTEYDRSFAVPRGVSRPLAGYTSIQHQFPNTYGINAYGPPDDADTRRIAQTRQLKGYLLVFEQLLADFFAQLGHARELLSTRRTLDRTYFHQSLRGLVPDVEALLDGDYERRLGEISQGADPGTDRRARFLDLLLALHGEQLEAPLRSSTTQGPEETSAQAKIALLEHLVAVTRDRGRSFDNSAPPSARNVTGMELRSRIELGLDGHQRPLQESLENAGLELASEGEGTSIGRPLNGASDAVGRSFDPVSTLVERAAQAVDPAAPPPILPLRRHITTEGFLHKASELANLWVGALPDESDISLLFKTSSGEQARLLGKYPDLDTALAAAMEFRRLFRSLKQSCHQLYIVEHTLLRFGWGLLRQQQSETSRNAFCSFTISAVLSRPAEPEGSEGFEQAARDVIRQNTPAHIAVEYCFLRPSQMRQFEELYWGWRRALHQGPPRVLIHATNRLRHFLEHRRSPG
jgi:hypothetical protein